jgi:hypothetical protein
LAEAEIVKPHLLEELQNEISELIAILVTVVKNTKKRKNRP